MRTQVSVFNELNGHCLFHLRIHTLGCRNGTSQLIKRFVSLLVVPDLGGAPFTYEPSLKCSSTCTATGLDLESVIPEYKLIQKKKKKSSMAAGPPWNLSMFKSNQTRT